MKEPVAVLQLVNQFAIGGAEGQFVARLRGHPEGFRPVVGCVHKVGPHLAEVRALGHEPEVFGLQGSLLQPNTARQVARLAAFLQREQVRLVHANDFYANVLAVPAARLAGARVICSRFDLGHWYSRAHRFAEALACRAADAVLANADAVRSLLVEQEGVPPGRVTVVRNGIDLAAFDAASKGSLSEPIPEGRPTVTLVGNLHPVKGHLDLLAAIEELRRTFPDVLVLCAGEGPMRPVLEQQLAHRGLEHTVLLLGHRLDVPALLARTQVAVIPSHAEGLSNAAIEAMAAGVPVVATAVGGNPELVADGQTGLLVPPRDAGALAAQVGALLRDPDRARALGRAGRARVERELTLPAMSRSLGDLYRAVLGEGRKTPPADERTAA